MLSLASGDEKGSSIIDLINQIKSAIKVQKVQAFGRLFNPLGWLQKVLRIPFLLIQSTGFNVAKVEDHLLGKLFKLLELLLLIYLGTHILRLSKENLLAFLNVIPK